MSNTAESVAEASSSQEKFAEHEYTSITQIFSSGLNAMAVLLTLFFIFTGAMLNYVGGLFTDMGKTEIHPIILWNTDFRILQVYAIVAVGAVLTGWSLCFVLVFRNIAGTMFERASKVEARYPDLSEDSQGRLFAVLHHWYNTSSRGALKWLYRTTVMFYLLMAGAYVAILASAIKVHIHPIEKTATAAASNPLADKNVPKP
jgi:hypothetical protein